MHAVTKNTKRVWIFPREHGAWAMLIMPFLLGMAISGATFWHALAGIGLFFGYLAMNAMLTIVRQPKRMKEALLSLVVYSGVAGLFLLAPFLSNPSAFAPMLAMFPLIGVSLLFIIKKKERHFGNDLVGITALTMLLPIAAFLGNEVTYENILLAMLLNIIYFTGSVFYVKALFREKTNQSFRLIGILFHVIVIAAVLIIHAPSMIALLFVPGCIKMISVLKINKLTPMTVGITEIVNTVWFLAGAFILL